MFKFAKLKKRLKHVALIVALLIACTDKANSQDIKIAHITVQSGSTERINTPVSTNLNNLDIHLKSDRQLVLYEHTDDGLIYVPSQLDTYSSPKMLRWILSGNTPAHKTRNFILKNEPASDTSSSNKTIYLEDDGKSLTFYVDAKKVLSYRYTQKEAPEGVSELYSRSGYIHPLYSPAGEIVTRIQPSDHYHHYGIWNPWTRTEFEGRQIDFWNLGDGQGTVRAKSVPLKISGDVFGGFEAVLNHVDLKAPSREKIALKEKWGIKIWNADPEQDVWLIDFTSTLNPATDSPLTIKAYRYQGFSIRATEKWSDDTATLLTSKGKNKSNGNATRARWTDINGKSELGTSGVLMMTHPGNRNYPEQLRIWPTGANEGKENVYFNFNPAQEQDWRLEPGNTYSLNYRMMVYDGNIDSTAAERYWQDFGNPPKVTVNPVRLTGSKVLLYTKNGEGYVHKNISNSIQAIRELAQQNGFMVDTSENPADFTPENLAQYDALIFSNTNNEAFDNEAQRQAFQHYIRSGGGFVGIHSASGSERDWPWYWKLLGGTFHRHAPFQEFTVNIADLNHLSTLGLPTIWVREDECYYLKQMNRNTHALLLADMETVEDDEKGEYPGDMFGKTFPLAWYHEFEGGRSWYTSLGHSIEDYDDPVFRKHLLGGIEWAVSGN